MADNVDVTPGSGKTVATDERSVGGNTVQLQRVIDTGMTAVATGQVVPTSSGVTLLAARDTRKEVTFLNSGTVTVFIGPSGVTTSTGFRLAPGAAITLPLTAIIYAIVSGSVNGLVDYIEVYD